MKTFIQNSSKRSTMESWREILDGNSYPSFGAFAYVTDSGAAQLATYLRKYICNGRPCRWIFGIDYGRSHPTAIHKIANFGKKSEVRIYDGAYVVSASGFTPRISYHLKTALTFLPDGGPDKQIVGSGNLSASGLLAGIEAGCLVDYSKIDKAYGAALVSDLEFLWEKSTPFQSIIDDYEARYAALSRPTLAVISKPKSKLRELFWIDVGYVTKNRGKSKPGNQFDLPRGAHIYLGLGKIIKPKLNSVLGELKIQTLIGETITRSLRYGNNAMEKLTLPIPEDYGYQCYDGKILTFENKGVSVVLEAFEHDDFFRIYGKQITTCHEMQSGRRYGTMALQTS